MTKHDMWRRLGLGVVALVCATLASCVPAKEPLSDAMKAEADKDLIGTWMRDMDGQTEYLIVGRHAAVPDVPDKIVPQGLMWFERYTFAKDGKLNRGMSGALFVSRIKGERYANVVEDAVVQESQKQQAWTYPADTAIWLVRYQVKKNTLTVSYPDQAAAKDLIGKGAIKGTKNMGSDDVTLAGGSGLADYLTKEGGKTLFPEESAENWKRAKVVGAE